MIFIPKAFGTLSVDYFACHNGSIKQAPNQIFVASVVSIQLIEVVCCARNLNLSNEELLKIILHGHEQLSLDSNAKILTATLEYTQSSKHFKLVMKTCLQILASP